MFTEVQIENYKSIQSLKINLGRVNVFIGENGCGKTNILEAIALAAAAAADKLDNEFLVPRGIRVTEPEFMRSAFDKENVIKEIKINLRKGDQFGLSFAIQNKNKDYSPWEYILREVPDQLNEVQADIEIVNLLKNDELIPDEISFRLHQIFHALSTRSKERLKFLKDFVIFFPENSALRNFEEEGQVQPLGTKGEGLLKLLRVLSNTPERINEIKQRLEFIDWFDDFKIHQDSDIERTIQIKDRYLDKDLPYFNQRSSNEGFLFLMFYFALFVSDDTPKFFAIDNIENALNPKLCTRLIQELVELAKKHDKQVIFTTHNPAILDGLDLNDDEQRLFVIYRNMEGHTQARRIAPLDPLDDGEIVPLSEAFINGYIGGLPKNF
ncbi:AAA family ATPase [Pseudanabaena sp. FACHB-1277]|uniref:AAA family ATPase n=1 Tax=Pseudanabaena cinerea FACHB-1277 TaxID=2949581 RepID=A0A926UQF7_9CYAN|nr:AAA family ATPase [Pseudanabaena cinerea]MBD2148936.1 AAA family ATPase [Pseudanabaena cinerea FACHB-1277]